MEDKTDELVLHLDVLEQALRTLDEVLVEPFSLIVRDAAIQRFEYTFELAWKLFRRVAKLEGVDVASPRQAIRTAFHVGLLAEVDPWFELLADRTRTSHTYSAKSAGAVFESATRLPSSLWRVAAEVRRRYLAGTE